MSLEMKPPESLIILINGRPRRVSRDWVWLNCDGRGARKTVKDFEVVAGSERGPNWTPK